MAKIPAPKEFREYLRKIGRKGGKARLTKMTPEKRQEIARLAGVKSAEVRAGKKAAGEKSTPTAAKQSGSKKPDK
jgi:hypothetical protein